MECQSEKSLDFGLQADDSYHLPKKKEIKTNSSQVRGCLKKWTWQGWETFCCLCYFFLPHFFKLRLMVVPLFKRGILSKKRSKEKFYYNLKSLDRRFHLKFWNQLLPAPPPPPPTQQGTTEGSWLQTTFYKWSGVPWGRAPGMPTGKCIRLRNWEN